MFIFKQNPRESNNKEATCSLTWLYRTPSTLDSNRVSRSWTCLVNGLRHQRFCSTSKLMERRSSYIRKPFATKHYWNWLQRKMLRTVVIHFALAWLPWLRDVSSMPGTKCCHLGLRRKRQRTLDTPKLVITRVISYPLSFAVHNCNFIQDRFCRHFEWLEKHNLWFGWSKRSSEKSQALNQLKAAFRSEKKLLEKLRALIFRISFFNFALLHNLVMFSWLRPCLLNAMSRGNSYHFKPEMN